jgi:hypothetical protein
VALTRARLRWSTAPRFWRAVPEINAELASSKGLLLRIGVAPVGLQSTLSLWRNADAMRAFAHAALPHRTVIRRSRDERWYAEELFARFAVTARWHHPRTRSDRQSRLGRTQRKVCRGPDHSA